MKRQPESTEGEWTWFDQALLYSAGVVDAALRGRLDALPAQVATTFPPQLASAERILTSGWYVLSEWTAPGDGSYARDSGWFFATGPVGLAASAAVAGVRAAGNASRRAAAAAAAVPRWLEVDRGDLYVSTAGFYLGSRLGLRAWGWQSVLGGDVVDVDCVRLVGQSTSGQVVWLIRSPWAPLLFALWAASVHPSHPTFVTNAWLPHGWWERATSLGRRPAIGWSQR